MPQVAEVHGVALCPWRLAMGSARRALARRLTAGLMWPMSARTRSKAHCCPGGLVSRSAFALFGRGPLWGAPRTGCPTCLLATARPWSIFAWPSPLRRSQPRCRRSQPPTRCSPPDAAPRLSLDPGRCAPRVMARLRLQPQGYVVLSPGAAVRRPGQALASGALCRRSRQGRCRCRWCCWARPKSARCAPRSPGPADAGGRPLPGPVGPHCAGRGAGLGGAARAVVSNDSGLVHVAAAFGTRRVALLGSSSPLPRTPPLSAQATVVLATARRPGLRTAPGLRTVLCPGLPPGSHPVALSDIAPERVLALL